VIKACFFDLDHTLWDFDTNAEQTFREMFVHFGCEHMLEKMPQFLSRYKVINQFYWDKYNKNQVGKDELRWRRAESLYGSFGIKDSKIWESFIAFYAEEAPKKNTLCPGAEELLLTIANKNIPMLILTNGFESAQHLKVKNTAIEGAYKYLVTSDAIGVKKPSKQFFDHALALAGVKPEEVVMLGDNYHNDYKGALNAGLHSYLYDPEQKKIQCKHRISHLSEFERILNTI